MKLETLQEIKLFLLSLFSIYLHLISASINDTVKLDGNIPKLNCTVNQDHLEAFKFQNSWIYVIRKFFLAETVLTIIPMTYLYGAINQDKKKKLISGIKFLLYTKIRNFVYLVYFIVELWRIEANYYSLVHQVWPICDKLPDWLEENIALNASYLVYFALNKVCLEWTIGIINKDLFGLLCKVFTLDQLINGDYRIQDLYESTPAETESNDRPANPANAEKNDQFLRQE